MSGPALSPAPPPPLSPRGLQVREAGRALKVQHSDAPHLVSLGGGRLSTAVTLHPLPQGEFSEITFFLPFAAPNDAIFLIYFTHRGVKSVRSVFHAGHCVLTPIFFAQFHLMTAFAQIYCTRVRCKMEPINA